ncbi:MlaD family protein [Massilia sp. TS11]|uniref:MlaD family protein n=1 Tax=Massilia sp. TS11 TaxID=2908003 RepID=UPI001EDB0B05|nr:MlaD family protein [Massilia sp. TS11]MCG2586601.1 MlaD family protein [Massilia sp. TS11]
MENRSHALLTGFFTIALTVAAILAGIWFNRDRAERVPYLIATSQSVPGLNPQATVRYRGIAVGKVVDIDFDPKLAGQILIQIAIDPDTPVTRTTYATLGYQGVTGIAYIQLDDDKTGSPRVASSANDMARIPLQPGLLAQLEKRGTAILARVEQLTDQLNALTGPSTQQRVQATLERIGQAADAYAAIPQKLEPTLARLPELTTRVDQTLNNVGQLSGSANRLVNNLDRIAVDLQAPNGPLARLNTTIDRVGAATEGIASNIELQTLPNVNAATDEARSTLRSLKRTMNTLNDRPQSLLFGAPPPAPGPGEPGFVPPAK